MQCQDVGGYCRDDDLKPASVQIIRSERAFSFRWQGAGPVIGRVRDSRARESATVSTGTAQTERPGDATNWSDALVMLPITTENPPADRSEVLSVSAGSPAGSRRSGETSDLAAMRETKGTRQDGVVTG